MPGGDKSRRQFARHQVTARWAAHGPCQASHLTLILVSLGLMRTMPFHQVTTGVVTKTILGIAQSVRRAQSYHSSGTYGGVPNRENGQRLKTGLACCAGLRCGFAFAQNDRLSGSEDDITSVAQRRSSHTTDLVFVSRLSELETLEAYEHRKQQREAVTAHHA
jgi:hypothetical protein